MTGRSRLPGGEPRKASQKHTRRSRRLVVVGRPVRNSYTLASAQRQRSSMGTSPLGQRYACAAVLLLSLSPVAATEAISPTSGRVYGRRRGRPLRQGRRIVTESLLPRIAIALPGAGALDPKTLFPTPPASGPIQ